MGNIISDYEGKYNSTNSNDGKQELTSFSKIMNDVLLELDLYNGSREKSEIDFSSKTFRERLKDNSGNLIDINGMKYMSDDLFGTDDDNANLTKLSMDTSTPISNKYYNMKRAFCNASSTVPVNMIGVDLPDDNPDPNHKQRMVDGVPFYIASQAPLGILSSVELDNCLKYGDINGIEDAPGIYSINPNNAYFYDSSLINKIGNTRTRSQTNITPNTTALVFVDKTKPIYLSPINNSILSPSATPDTNVTPVGVHLGDNAMITVQYFPPDLIKEHIDNVNCIGLYAERNSEYLSDTNTADSKFNSQVVLYPLIISSIGLRRAKIDSGSRDNVVDKFLSYITTDRLISYNINEILQVNSSDALVGTQSINIVTKDSSDKLIKNSNYLAPKRISNDINFPDDLNYTLFFKQKTLINTQNITIADINKASEFLNDYSNKSVYGANLSEECRIKLDKLLTNSYVQADITKYSKLNNIYNPNDSDNKLASGLTTGNFKNYKLYQNKNNLNDISIRASDRRPNQNEYINWGVQNGTTETNASASIRDITGECPDFYTDLCDYYYKYDIIDGIAKNQTFINTTTVDKSISNYLKNFQFLGDHIPDCKCKNSFTIKSDTSLTPDKFWSVNQNCEYNNRIYGAIDAKDIKSSADSTQSFSGLGKIDPRETDASGGTVWKIYDNNVRDLNNTYDINNNKINTTDKITPFRRQVDPAYAMKNADVQMSDQQFIFAGKDGNARSNENTFNSYTCNLSITTNISGVGGNVLIAGQSMSCNFPGSTDKPAPTAGSMPTLDNFSGLYYSNLTKTNIPLDNSNSVVIDTNESIILSVGFPDNSYLVDFNRKYGFKFINDNDNSFQIAPAENCKNLPQNSMCQGSLTVKIPFLYGPTNNDSGVLYHLMLTKLNPSDPLVISNELSCQCILKQYSMKITNINIISQNGAKIVNFSISLNTSDMVRNIPYRVIFTSVERNPKVITVSGTDLFDAVSKNNGILSISDPRNPFNSTLAYTYEFKINETLTINSQRQSVYSDGYKLLYDEKMSTKYQDKIDFSTIKTGFNQFVLNYKDYDDNNKLNIVANNSTMKMGVTMIATWDFFTDDVLYSYINIYYTANSNKIKLNDRPLSVTDGIFYFIFPLFPTAQVVTINACAVDSDGKDIVTGKNTVDPKLPDYQSININLKSADVGTTFRSWKIITTQLFDPLSKIPFTISNQNTSSLSITNYLSYASSNKYNNILFDYNTDQWFYTTNALIPDTDTIISNNYVIFQALPLPTNFTIEDITYLDSNNNPISLFNPPGSLNSSSVASPSLDSSPESLRIMMGSLLNIKWKYVPASDININIQIKMFNNITNAFTIPAGTTNGTYAVILSDKIGNVNQNSTSINLLSYETNIVSNIKKLTNIIADPGISGSVDADGVVSINVTNPSIYINNQSRTPLSIIKTINLNISDELDNKFNVYFKNVADNLSITTINLSLSNIDITKSIEFIYSMIETETFSNVRYGLRKKYIEHFDTNQANTNQVNINKQIHIDRLNYDYSSIGTNFSKRLSIISTCNNYYSVYINTIIINLGSNSIDGYKFDLDFNGTYINQNTKFMITSVLIIGKLTTKIFFEKNINGLQNVIYKDQLGNNTKLVYLNGYYNLPEDFEPGIESPPPPPPPEDTGLPWWAILLIVIFILGLIGGGIYYFILKKKK